MEKEVPIIVPIFKIEPDINEGIHLINIYT